MDKSAKFPKFLFGMLIFSALLAIAGVWLGGTVMILMVVFGFIGAISFCWAGVRKINRGVDEVLSKSYQEL